VLQEKFDEYGTMAIVWILAEIGAVNWLVLELTNNDILYYLGISGGIQSLVYILIGLAGLVALLDDFSG
jgi:uncharacterized membrane protein YuzA (DUF378 family)